MKPVTVGRYAPKGSRVSVRPDGSPPEFDNKPSRRNLLAVGLMGVAVMAFLVVVTDGAVPNAEPEAHATTSSVDAATATTESTPTTTQRILLPEGSLPWALVFDDGSNGVVTVDLASGESRGMAVPGQRAGDQPYRLAWVGSRLVVGWGDIYAYAPEDREAQLIGEATIFIPAAETGEIWLVEYPGGFIGSGTPTAQRVTVAGQSTTEAGAIEGEGFPTLAVPGGLAIESEAGIQMWQPEGRDDQPGPNSVGRDRAHAVAVNAEKLIWCEEECPILHVLDLSSGEDTVLESNADAASFHPDSIQISASGQYLGAVTRSGSLVVWDLVFGRFRTLDFDVSKGSHVRLGWSPHREELFAVEGRGQGIARLFHYDAESRESSELEVALRDASSTFIVISRKDAAGLLER